MDREKIGARLREIRGSQSLKTVAHALKISPSAYSMYEQGERIPRDEIKKRIADYFGTTVQDLFYCD
jgi:transcriptional regulator with XRE-family HTH domain